jgi:hypothetical protein
MKKFLIALVIFLAIFFFITRFTEMQKIASVLQSGDWRYVGLALILETLWLINLGFTYKSIYKIFGLFENIKKMLILSITANFMGTIAPVAGLTGLAVFLTDAEKQKYSKGHVTVACIVFLLLDYIGLLLAISLGLVVLLRRNNLDWPELIASFILFLIASGLASILYLSKKNPNKLGNILAWVFTRINQVSYLLFKKNKFSTAQHAYIFASDAAEGMEVLHEKLNKLTLPFIHIILNKVFLIGILALLFLAFQTPFSVGTIIAGFSIANLFLIVSPTPSGIGVVEGIMTLFLHSLGVSLEEATIITLSYRGVTFWIPILTGFITFRFFSASINKKSDKQNSGQLQILSKSFHK